MAFKLLVGQRGGMRFARRADAVLVLVALVWGSSYLAAKTATAALPVPAVLFARYAISALACAALLAGRGRRWTRAEVRVGALLGVTQAVVLVLETYGVAYTSAANAGLIISLTIVLTPLLTPLLDRTGSRRLPWTFFLAAGLCVLAVGLLTSSTGLHTPRLGDVLVLVAAVVRAGHLALVGRLTAGRPMDSLHLTTAQTVVGTALFLPLAATQLPGLVHSGAATWAQLIYLALFCTVFAFLAQTWAVQGTSAGRASLLLGTEPIWAVGVGIGLGGERLTLWATLGAMLMIAGTYWGQAIERAHRTTTARTGKEDETCPTVTPTSV